MICFLVINNRNNKIFWQNVRLYFEKHQEKNVLFVFLIQIKQVRKMQKNTPRQKARGVSSEVNFCIYLLFAGFNRKFRHVF